MGIVELILMLSILPKRVTRLARERGRSGFLWTLAAIGAWVGGELLVIFVAALAYEIGVLYFGFTDGLETHPGIIVVYILALIAGLFGADIVRRVLTKIPVISQTALPTPPVFDE